MITVSREISGYLFKVSCHQSLQDRIEWFFRTLSSIGYKKEFEDGLKIQIGWSILTLRRQGEAFTVLEPDFDSDPFHASREDITCTLTILIEQAEFLSSLRVDGLDCVFQDKIVVAKGCLNAQKIYLERTPNCPVGDSGWFIGPADTDEPISEYEGIFAYELLSFRRPLMRVLALPPGFLVVFNGEKLEALLNEKNENILL